jgi:hypothetical protein
MTPQTDTELTLWNYGRNVADAQRRGKTLAAAEAHMSTLAGFEDVRRAVMTLGYDLSNAWIQEGYHSEDRTRGRTQ